MSYKRGVSHHRAMQAGRAACNRPRFDEPTTLRTEPVESVLTDWPEITSVHPDWWQVHRVERHGDAHRLVLIAERRSEQAAFDVLRLQLHQCCISRVGDREDPFVSKREPLVVVGV